MREKKFKAWLPGISKMTYAHTLEELMNWDTKKEDNGTAIWLQWIGLHDKNGKEIYEDDIIEIKHPHKGRRYVGPVVYDKYGYSGKDFYFPHYDNQSDAFEDMTYVEVIGNIHENPQFVDEMV